MQALSRRSIFVILIFNRTYLKFTVYGRKQASKHTLPHSLANLSPLYRHRSRNVTSSVENSAVKLMRGCRSLMNLMNCSRLSFVSVHTKNTSSMYLCSPGSVGLAQARPNEIRTEFA